MACSRFTVGNCRRNASRRGPASHARNPSIPSTAVPSGSTVFAVTASAMTRDATLADLARNWPRATLRADAGATAPYVDRIFAPQSDATPLPLLVKRTNLQVRVWEALLRIPPGETATYGSIAAEIGQPRAARAVGNAVGHNAVSWLIPCHRVIRGTGIIGHYRWGSDRKCAMLAWEAVRLTDEAAE